MMPKKKILKNSLLTISIPSSLQLQMVAANHLQLKKINSLKKKLHFLNLKTFFLENIGL